MVIAHDFDESSNHQQDDELTPTERRLKRREAATTLTRTSTTSTNSTFGVQLAGKRQHLKTVRQAPVAGQTATATPDELAAANKQVADTAAAYALDQENKKAASKLNAEKCHNFSVGIQHEFGGVFTSPNYPEIYPPDLICTKLIKGKSLPPLVYSPHFQG